MSATKGPDNHLFLKCHLANFYAYMHDLFGSVEEVLVETILILFQTIDVWESLSIA